MNPLAPTTAIRTAPACTEIHRGGGSQPAPPDPSADPVLVCSQFAERLLEASGRLGLESACPDPPDIP